MRIFNSTQNALSKQSPRAKKMISGSFHSKCQKIPPSNAQITAYMSVYIADFTYVCVYICMVSCESYDPFTHLSSRTPPPPTPVIPIRACVPNANKTTEQCTHGTYACYHTGYFPS